MATIILPYSRILHVPKTGGTWMTQAIKDAQIPHIIDPRHDNHANLATAVGKHQYTIAFVRDPLDWWRSNWAMRQIYGWNSPEEPLQKYCQSDDFNEFIEKALINLPGYCGTVYEDYVGPIDNEIDFIGRFENITEDFITALQNAGEVFDPEFIRERGRYAINRSQDVVKVEYRPDLRLEMIWSEIDTIRRFNYEYLLEEANSEASY